MSPQTPSSPDRAAFGTAQHYAPETFESAWQARWEDEGLHRALNPGDAGFDPEAEPYYVLDMFPYPSGAGLHVGHPTGYIGTDIIARKKRMEGCNVLHPMGYDAFGLPAEQYAIQTGQHPGATTDANIKTFRRQLQAIGLSFDWSRELKTCDPAYYKWTQWIFARLFERGLAYQTEVAVWWCEELKTVLANEEVIQGKSERGGHPCERRPLKQWMLKITAYADRLLEDLELVDWPESVKTMQREWIGKSEGAAIHFPLEQEADERIEVFTTRPDTLFGATFMVLAPEHALVERLTTDAQRADVDAYVQAASLKSDLERTDLAKGKTGVFTGAYALNPLMDPSDPAAKVPIWIADYVLASYGTGAIMAVPGHDTRDHEFAEQYGLRIVEVVAPPAGAADAEGCFTGDGTAVNSGPLDGLDTPAAKAKVIELLEAQGAGAARTNYRLRDWLFSRQRYWGEPFPIVHGADGPKRVADADLPVVLPDMDDFTPSADGSAPLARAKDWVRTTDPETGAPAERDTDTMPGWAGSCWYYLRFMDPANDAAPVGPEVEQYWGGVDLYVGGAEHAVLHLLYARFWHKFLFDEGVVSTPEPFTKLFNQGMLTAFAYKDASGRLVPSDEVELDGERATAKATGEELERVTAKMSKSLKNVVNPDDVIAEYGVDTFRIYEMFMGPLGDSKPWNPRDVAGSRRFLEKVWRLFVDQDGEGGGVREHLMDAEQSFDSDLERALNQMLERVEQSFDGFNFNTAIAAMMTFVNEAQKRVAALTRSQAERFLCALAPFAPHISDELWARLGHDTCIRFAAWPEVDPESLKSDTVELVVQVMGKKRATVTVAAQCDEETVFAEAAAVVPEWLEGKEIVKRIHVPGRLVNFVAK